MRVPRSKTVTRALGLVVLTIGITSPLLTIFSTILLTTPLNAAHGIPAPYNTLPLNHDQLISELGRAYGGRVLELATAVSGSVLLLFASNTAIIGAYHVFLALSRMRFFPTALQRTGAFRGTPHVAILLAAGIPMLVLVAVRGSIEVLGNLYAFGLLGAFILTCVSLDVIRWRERHSGVLIGAHEDPEVQAQGQIHSDGHKALPSQTVSAGAWGRVREQARYLRQAIPGDQEERLRHVRTTLAKQRAQFVDWTDPLPTALRKAWPDIRYYLGFPTTLLVAIAWVTNLFSKPDATLFGGGLTLLGVGIAVVNYRVQQRAGEIPVFPLALLRPVHHSILVALPASSQHPTAVVRTAVDKRQSTPTGLRLPGGAGRRGGAGLPVRRSLPLRYDGATPLLPRRDECQRAGVSASFVYRVGGLDTLLDVWRAIRPDEILVEEGTTTSLARFVAPDYVRYSVVDGVRVAHDVRHHLAADEGARAAELSSRLPSAPTRTRSESGSGSKSRPLDPASGGPQETLRPGPGRQHSAGQESPPTESTTETAHSASAPGAGEKNLDDWMWTGTDLVRREPQPRKDEPPTN